MWRHCEMSGTLIEELGRCRCVHIDSNVLIYWIEKKDPYRGLIRPLFERIHQGQMRGVSSMLTLAELLVHPLKERRFDLVREYKRILMHSLNFRLVGIDAAVAELCARLRADHESFKTPDCLQLASALQSNAEAFVTNDVRLKQCDRIRVVALNDLLGGP